MRINEHILESRAARDARRARRKPSDSTPQGKLRGLRYGFAKSNDRGNGPKCERHGKPAKRLRILGPSHDGSRLVHRKFTGCHECTR